VIGTWASGRLIAKGANEVFVNRAIKTITEKTVLSLRRPDIVAKFKTKTEVYEIRQSPHWETGGKYFDDGILQLAGCLSLIPGSIVGTSFTSEMTIPFTNLGKKAYVTVIVFSGQAGGMVYYYAHDGLEGEEEKDPF
jgi:hypothetical protein